MKLFLLVCLALLPGFGRCGEPVPAVAVFEEACGLASASAPHGPLLQVALWPDGRILWSHKKPSGEVAFLTGHVPPARVQALLDLGEREKVFDAKSFDHSNYGPDAAFTTIWLEAGARHTRLESWHELYERNPKAVALSYGLTTLNEGQTREQALRGDTPEYQSFRRVWSDLRAGIAALVPARGEPYRKPVQIDYPR